MQRNVDTRMAKGGNVVIPLDELRSIDYTNLLYSSGVLKGSGGIYHAIASGKEGYIREIWVTELSGIAGGINFYDAASGQIIPTVKLTGGEDKIVKDICIGPIQSGIVVGCSGESIAANVTVVVQVDPRSPHDFGPK